MTRRIISGAREAEALAVAKPDCLQMLAHVADARAEFARRLGILFVMLKQMCIRSQHRSAPAGIGDDWRVIVFESIDVLSRQSARAFDVTCVCMQRTTTHLGVGSLNAASVNFQHSGRRFVNPFEESFSHATFEEQNRSAGSTCILRA